MSLLFELNPKPNPKLRTKESCHFNVVPARTGICPNILILPVRTGKAINIIMTRAKTRIAPNILILTGRTGISLNIMRPLVHPELAEDGLE